MAIFRKDPTEAAEKDFNADQWVSYVMDGLEALDKGKKVEIDFMATPDVDGFCKAIGFRKSWAGRTVEDIAPPAKATGVNVVPLDEARVIRDMVLRMIAEGRLRSRDAEKPLEPTVLNDFIAKGAPKGAPALGHEWEFAYALAVELEHGRTAGANVTNNHPLLTGLVVLAHVVEDSLYYARLQVMELEGEVSKAVREGKKPAEVGDLAIRLEHARVYLARRIVEKSADLDQPDR